MVEVVGIEIVAEVVLACVDDMSPLLLQPAVVDAVGHEDTAVGVEEDRRRVDAVGVRYREPEVVVDMRVLGCRPGRLPEDFASASVGYDEPFPVGVFTPVDEFAAPVAVEVPDESGGFEFGSLARVLLRCLPAPEESSGVVIGVGGVSRREGHEIGLAVSREVSEFHGPAAFTEVVLVEQRHVVRELLLLELVIAEVRVLGEDYAVE